MDTQHGGLFNAQGREGAVLDENKRIWVVMEVLRASALMQRDDVYGQRAKNLFGDLLSLFVTHYIDPRTGYWHEVLHRDLTPQTDYMPGTTPYHIYPVLCEINQLI